METGIYLTKLNTGELQWVTTERYIDLKKNNLCSPVIKQSLTKLVNIINVEKCKTKFGKSK